MQNYEKLLECVLKILAEFLHLLPGLLADTVHPPIGDNHILLILRFSYCRKPEIGRASCRERVYVLV